MTAILLAVLAAQSDPRIESIERLIGNARRPYHWTPLAVTVRSAAGFKGDLVALSSMGIRIVRKIHVSAGGSERFLLPAIDPQKIIAGDTIVELPKDLKSPDFVVLVDGRLPYAGKLPSNDPKVLYHRIETGDLKDLLAQGLLDACDLLLLKDTSGLQVGSVAAWAAAPTRSEADRAVAEKLRPQVPALLVDLDLWSLAPEGGWVPAKKDRAVLFAALYALAGFAGLVFIGRGRARAAPGVVAGVAALGIASFLLFFPRKHLWILEKSCEVVPLEGDARVVRLWFAGAAAEGSPTLDFPRIVKPVFAKSGDTEEPMTIRVREQGGCSVEAFRLSVGRSGCFVGMEGRAPTMRATDRVTHPLHEASVRIGGVDRFVGDLAAGSQIPRPMAGSPPRPSEDRVWLRFLDGDGLYGTLDSGVRVAEDIGSPDLADGRRGPSFFVQRLR